MSFAQLPPYDSSGGDVIAIVEDFDRGRSLQGGAGPQALLGTVGTGSAGVVVPVTGYGLYLPYIGTSPSVVDSRAMARTAPATIAPLPTNETPPSGLKAVLALSVPHQAREALAALALNKTQLAGVLGVSRPTLYDWLDGKEPNALNAQRLTMVLRLLASAGITSASPLSPRFLRQALTEGGPSLLEALSAESIDESLVSSLAREAKALGEQAQLRRTSREERLRALGFDSPSDAQRREQLARNVAMRDWPKP